LPRDYAPPVKFCEWLQANLDFLPHLLLTDEATFTRDGINNTRNLHTSVHQNPRNIIVRSYHHRYSVNVWCGLLGSYLIGPHFFKGHLTKAFYREFLQSHLPLYLENVPLAIRCLWMQHDGTAPHATREVTALHNEHLAD
jgi:hypothetical protein